MLKVGTLCRGVNFPPPYDARNRMECIILEGLKYTRCQNPEGISLGVIAVYKVEWADGFSFPGTSGCGARPENLRPIYPPGSDYNNAALAILNLFKETVAS